MIIAELTTEAIDSMPAGREMDEVVAERVMEHPKPNSDPTEDPLWLIRNQTPDNSGWLRSITGEQQNIGAVMIVEWKPKPYSTDIAVAWEVVEKYVVVGCAGWVEGDGHTGYRAGVTNSRGRFEADAETAPLAICRAALKATNP